MYYLCKVFDTWTLYDGEQHTSRQLNRAELEVLKSLFPTLMKDGAKMLEAVQVSAINPNKLMNLSAPVVNTVPSGTASTQRSASS